MTVGFQILVNWTLVHGKDFGKLIMKLLHIYFCVFGAVTILKEIVYHCIFRAKALSVVKNLCALAWNATLGDLTSMERMVSQTN